METSHNLYSFYLKTIFPYNVEPVLDRNMFNYTHVTEVIPRISGDDDDRSFSSFACFVFPLSVAGLCQATLRASTWQKYNQRPW
jgi:hypothetical protein